MNDFMNKLPKNPKDIDNLSDEDKAELIKTMKDYNNAHHVKFLDSKNYMFPSVLSKMYSHTIPPDHRLENFNLFRDVIKVFNEHNIIWWADKGTLLSTIKFGGQCIFHDNNNIGCVSHNIKEQLDKILPELKKLATVEISKKNGVMTIYKRERVLKYKLHGRDIVIGEPSVSVILYEKKGRKLYPSKGMLTYGGVAVINYNHVFPLRTAKYNNFSIPDECITINIPQNQVKILDLYYSSCWKTHWTLFPRMTCTEEEGIIKTWCPYVEDSYYPCWNDENFIKCFETKKN